MVILKKQLLNTYYVTHTLYSLYHLILTTTFLGRYFTKVETESERLNDSFIVTQLISGS